jgi:hypothetical protein
MPSENLLLQITPNTDTRMFTTMGLVSFYMIFIVDIVVKRKKPCSSSRNKPWVSTPNLRDMRTLRQKVKVKLSP